MRNFNICKLDPAIYNHTVFDPANPVNYSVSVDCSSACEGGLGVGELELAPLEPRLCVVMESWVGWWEEEGGNDEGDEEVPGDRPPLVAGELLPLAVLAESSLLNEVSSASIFTILSFRLSEA